MQVNLSSTELSLKINTQGAELCSVKNNNGIEFIWQGNQTFWARHAPVLFPIVGKLKNNRFTFNSDSFELPQHGFARDMEFELVSNTPSSCTFRLTSSEETKKKYPFDFIFDISYLLNGGTLTTTYSVKNNSREKIYFSVGAHPGFNCPLMANEKFEDYVLEFEHNGYQQTPLEEGLLSKNKHSLELNNKLLPLSVALFAKDALVFENAQIKKITLRHTSGSNKIVLHCEGWPYFGIWAKKDCDKFVCLEPWYGITDAVDASGNLPEKKRTYFPRIGKRIYSFIFTHFLLIFFIPGL